MKPAHFPHWPAGLPFTLDAPQSSLCTNLVSSAERFGDRPAMLFFGRSVFYRELMADVDRLAATLQRRCAVAPGDRVLLQMQNCPQFVTAYYAILRAGAVVVPVNPMLLTAELQTIVADSGACMAIVACELVPGLMPLLADGAVRGAIVATYADYLGADAAEAPEVVRTRAPLPDDPRLLRWQQALDTDQAPAPVETGPDTLACLAYTSGTTGQPKGCMHPHRSVMFGAVGSAVWAAAGPTDVYLVSLPLFHVTGMQVSMNAPIHAGATMVIMPRWDRSLAARLIARHRVTVWSGMPTMMIDFLSDPALEEHDLSSLRRLSGGGAAMPEPVAQRLFALTGREYIEGYGLTETMAATHSNPAQRPKRQCLGVPLFNVDARVIDPDTLGDCEPGTVGEIVIHGPQVFAGYWRDDAKTRAAFIDIDGRAYLRSGDLGYVDADGYFFFVDRLKRMINASGYKVWPAEVEAVLQRHPEVRACCVVGSGDPYRGETVKAIVVRRDGSELDDEALIAWARTQMAAYKVPRRVEWVERLPTSATGKLLWRQLQDAERAAS